jgi:hypothetical protein
MQLQAERFEAGETPLAIPGARSSRANLESRSRTRCWIPGLRRRGRIPE